MRFGLMICLAVTAVVATSCAHDAPSAPSASDPRHTPSTPSNSLLLANPATIVPLHRTSPLTANEQVSATIGLLGGTLRLPSAGLTLIVPPLAVTSPTTITATARAGSDVAYELAPHGLTFLTPIVALQDLHGTEAASGGLIDPLALLVGYFPNALDLTSVTELLSVSVNLLGQTSTALLWHFSGYVWSSGREEPEPGDSTRGSGT